MWSTVFELGRPRQFDVVREKLRGVAADGVSVEFGEQGTITIGLVGNAPSASAAIRDALERFAFLMMSAGLTLEPREIRTQSTGRRSVPDLAGTSEIAEILGVTKSRVSQLIRSERFPARVARLAMGPIYLKRDIDDFERARRENARNG
jgi:transcriptional regulator with XRE-family HTH domain